jgi:KipI family sensor histidine kinase inhibitor
VTLGSAAEPRRLQDGVLGMVPYGDQGVLVETATAAVARQLRAGLRARGLGSQHVVGWSSLLVLGSVTELMRQIPHVDIALTLADRPTTHEIPVIYDGEDLEAVADALQLHHDEVIDRHASVTYVTECLGFTRGFPYLSGLDPVLQLPRLATPRRRVPAGSVAMAGEQVGIYPMESPGGWHLLGRTHVSLFDPADNPPSRLQPGDRVRFIPC